MDHFNDNSGCYQFYGDSKEEVSPNAPVVCDRGFNITNWVYAGHAGNYLNKQRPLRALIFGNSALVV